MRRKILIIAVLLLIVSTMGVYGLDKKDLSPLWDKANTAYNNGDYAGAVMLYDSIAAEGYVSAKLFYNMGNAHFRMNNLGKAILNYNKARRLAPTDRDVEYNLNYANSMIKDRIEPVPDVFFNTWIKNVRSQLNSNQWAIISLVMLAVALASVLVYMLAQKNSLRKSGFYGAVLFAALFVISIIFAGKERKELLDSSQAIVMNASISVKSSPEETSQDLFILHEGTLVELSDSHGQWTEITIANGNKGWVKQNSIERIEF